MDIEFKELSLSWTGLNSFLIRVLSENRPAHVIDQLLCPIELRVSNFVKLILKMILFIVSICVL